MKIIKYFFEALIVYFFFILIRIIGINFGRKISSKLFLFFGRYIKSEEIINKNISYVFKDISDNDKKKIIKSMWKNYGFTFAEYIYLKKFRENSFENSHIEIIGREILDDIIKSKKQVIFVSCHFANFEIMSMELEKYNINLAAIYRPLNNYFLNPFMVYLRKNYICKNQIEKGLKGSRKVIDHMSKKHSIALMVDQRLGESERFEFFGKPAHTTTLPAQLSLRFKCNIIPIYLERINEDKFKMEIYKPIEFNDMRNDKNFRNETTLKINKIMEDMIKKNPHQWIWTHDRWK
tara:strand:- start:9953 stop:10828 length:876 start_codon:yes stop_codon:yes gene_type:complete